MFSNAFLIVWNDVSSATEYEYRRWHRVEHMPERLAIPGFMLGRRYADLSAAKYRFLTIYETASTDVFSSAPYRASLASPTPWTTRMSAQMTNFVRRVCRTAASASNAVGGAVATFHFRDAGEADRLVRMVCELDGVTGAHVGVVDEAATGARRDEMQLRSRDGIDPFDAVLIVEGDDRAALARLNAALIDCIAQCAAGKPAFSQHYDLALVFHPTHTSATGQG